MRVISASLADRASRRSKELVDAHFESRRLDLGDLITIEEAAESISQKRLSLARSHGTSSGGGENGSAEGTRECVLRGESEIAAERVETPQMVGEVPG